MSVTRIVESLKSLSPSERSAIEAAMAQAARAELAKQRQRFDAVQAALNEGIAPAKPAVTTTAKVATTNGNGHGKKPRRAVKSSVAPKYRDPDNPQNTWAGRGKAPRWLTAAEKSGKSRQDFRIGA